MEDAELIERMLGRDRDAAATLFRRYLEDVYAFAYDPVAHAGRAEVLWALGRHEEARAAEARAKELGGGRTGVRFVRDR